MPKPVAAYFEWEGATCADGYWTEFRAAADIPDAWEDPPTRRTDLFSASQLAERDAAWQAHLDDLKETHTYFLERSAQRSQRLWQWAHEELGEPLKTRYFHIVANGTADWMEQPVYAQQFNSLKHERDQLRAELEAMRADAERTARNRDMWKSQCERQAAELEALRRGEFICSKCGLRKDADASGPAPF